jgi:hypothetical protein
MLNYLTAGTHAISITVLDSLGLSDTVNFQWVIADAGFDVLTATEMHGSLTLPNSQTDGSLATLWVAPGNSVALTVAAIAPKLLANLDDIFFSVSGGATPSSGDFSPTPVITVGAPGSEHVVTAWLDEDLDRSFDSGEFARTLTIRVISFGSAEIVAGRIDAGVLYPGEDLLRVKSGELYDITSTFEYAVLPAADTVLGPGAIVRGQLVRSDFSAVIANGTNIGDLTVLLTAAMEGEARARFYIDANFNGAFDSGELSFVSNPFYIVPRHHMKRTFQYNIYNPVTQAEVQGAVDASMELALRRDTEDDWRAAVFTTVVPAPTVYFVPGIPRHDPTTSRSMIDTEHFDEHDGLTILSGMTDPIVGTLLGRARRNSNALVIDWNLKAVDTIVHELGHNLDLDHNGLGADYIMEAEITGSNDHLTYLEAKVFSAF